MIGKADAGGGLLLGLHLGQVAKVELVRRWDACRTVWNENDIESDIQKGRTGWIRNEVGRPLERSSGKDVKSNLFVAHFMYKTIQSALQK